MRRILLALAGLVVLSVAAVTTLVTVPQAIEKTIEWTCSPDRPTDNCLVRMRAMGHVWSAKGDLARAQFWYAQAARGGDAAAMFHLAWLYEKAGEADMQAAIAGLSDEARADAMMEVPGAANALGNFHRAADWYRKSAEKGFAPAMNNLGELYQAGLGVGRDDVAAFTWHLAGARAGNPVAAMNTALDYRIGRGVAADAAEAETWSTWTAKRGSSGLGDLTLARTRISGSGPPAKERALIRAVANQGGSTVMTVAPLKPDHRLPTFRQVREQLEK